MNSVLHKDTKGKQLVSVVKNNKKIQTIVKELKQCSAISTGTG